MIMARTVFGSIEKVIFVDYDNLNVVAKIDTGAWSGALHCTSIKEEGDRLLFHPLGDRTRKVAVKKYEKRQVRSANGHVRDRYIVPVEIIIQGTTYYTTVGLTDRSSMQREMLLGRKFLIENNIIIDVALTLDEDYEAEKYL